MTYCAIETMKLSRNKMIDSLNSMNKIDIQMFGETLHLRAGKNN